MPKSYALLLGGLLFITLNTYGVTRTWIGADGDNWNNIASWAPAGVPTAADDVVISGFYGTIVINTSSANTFVQSLNIINGSDVIFAGNTSGRRMTISCAGCSSGIESGSAATFSGIAGSSACDLFFSQSPAFTVDGTLTFSGGGNSDLIAANASIVVQGSLVFSGAGSSRLVCTGGITVVNGAIVYAGGGSTLSANPSNLIVNDNAVYEIAKNGTNVPNANWSNSSTLKITGMTNDDPAFTNNAILGNLIWDCPGQVAPAVLNVNLSFNRVDIFDTGTSEIRVSAQSGAGQMRTWVINGDYTQSGGIVNLSSGNNGSGKINFKGGSFYASQTLTETSANGKGILEFSGSQAQSAYFGTLENTVDIIINMGDEVILNTRLTINAQSTLNLVSGRLITSAQNLLTISAGGNVLGGSLASHVIGPIRKAGNTAFVFPTGKNTTYAPIAISAPPAVTDTFTAEYFDDPFPNTTSYLPPLVRVSQLEHWQLVRSSGAGPVQVTLYWQDGNASGINDLSSLTVARFDGSDWINAGGTASGIVATGNIQSDITSVFDWFTFGAKQSAFNPLPVELTAFNAVSARTEVVLNWTTATEKNNAWFAIERSEDGRLFDEIGRTPGAGNSSTPRHYIFTDKYPLAGLNYYRLRQLDDDGGFSFSPVRAATIGNAGRLRLYPSPVTDLLHIRWNADHGTSAQWYIFDVAGRLTLSGTQDAGAQDWEIPVGQLPGGTYILTVETGQEKVRERFVKKK
jgi:hypothetical protein